MSGKTITIEVDYESETITVSDFGDNGTSFVIMPLDSIETAMDEVRLMIDMDDGYSELEH